MDGSEFIASLERDAVLIDALHCALYAMALVSGISTIIAGQHGTLQFGREMGKLRMALDLLGVDTTQPLPIPYNSK